MASTFNLFSVFLLLLFISYGGSAQKCGPTDMSITQSKTGGTVEGKPEYEVVIKNNCEGCSLSKLVLRCLGFSSVEPVDTRVLNPTNGGFCVINGGNPITNADQISFRYAWLTPFDLPVFHFDANC